MSLIAGTRLGPYEILGLIGVGGMGEVYKAKDTRLDRTVAIKVLPSDISADPDRRARFEREAKTIAALSHPHICTIHDVGEHAGSMFLVMEHLDGETLAQRVKKGALPIEQALTIATEIANALSAAHRHGIIHRDLKPSNVMLTKTGAKLLDFGLAKLKMAAAAGATTMTAVAVQEPITGVGVVVGTVPYMAPEQLEGKETDARSDIFSFGSVLYEMLTGRRAFDGESDASLIAAVLEHEPAPVSSVRAVTPPALDRLVCKCLQKNPDGRWQTAADLADELRWLATDARDGVVLGVTPRDSGRHWLTLRSVFATACLALVVVALSWGLEFRGSQADPVERLTIALAEGMAAPSEVAVSPDGRTIAFSSTLGQTTRLYLRRLDEWKITPLQGTEGATFSCFSPDEQSLAFSSSKGIQLIRLDGGPPVSIYAGADVEPGISWDAERGILFSRGSANEGVWRVSPAGGAPELVVRSENGEARYLHPQALPTGVVLFTIFKQGRASIAVADATGKVKVIRDNASDARYVPATRHLIYQSEGLLLGIRFELHGLNIVGDVAALARDVGNSDALHSEYDVSASGTLILLPPSDTQLVWIDRKGIRRPFWIEKRAQSGYVQISPDGRSAIVGLQRWHARQLFRMDLGRDIAVTRLTPGDDDYYGVFTPDGQEVLFTSSDHRGGFSVFVTSAGGGGVPRPETTAFGWQRATSARQGPDGVTFLFNDIIGPDGGDIWQQRLDRPDTKQPIVKGAARELEAAFSPDGHWIAYQSDETGRTEIYVLGYPVGPKTQVSTDGGRNPVWNPRGGEIFYAKSRAIVAVNVENGKRIGTPRVLFERAAYGARNWDVARDGERFLVAETTRPAEINVVTHWFEELKAKMLTK